MLTEVLDILMISETKLDYSFPEAQFYIGFRTPFGLDETNMEKVCYYTFEIILMLFYSQIMYFLMILKLSLLR